MYVTTYVRTYVIVIGFGKTNHVCIWYKIREIPFQDIHLIETLLNVTGHLVLAAIN